MTKPLTKEKIVRYTLGILLLVLGVNAFGGGIYGISGAKDVPLEWLKGSPFTTYFIPSIILMVGIGGSAMLAAILVMLKHRFAHKAAIGCSIIVSVWIIFQLLIIGYVSWLQPAIAAVGVCIFLLGQKITNYIH